MMPPASPRSLPSASRRISAGVALALSLSGPARALGPASDLPPEARVHNDRGIVLILAGQHEAAVDELLAAYAAMPDPLRYRAGRGKVIGSLRSAWTHLDATTGDPAHLCRLQSLLLLHLEGLLTALGPAARADDVAGTRAGLQEVRGALDRRGATCTPPARPRPPPAARPAPAPAPPPVPPLHDPAPDRRGLRIGGGVALGLGLAALATMTFGWVRHAAARADIQTHIDELNDAGRPVTPQEDAEVLARYHDGVRMRTLAAVSGALGGAALIVGAALLGAGRRGRSARAAPLFAPHFVGVGLRLAF
jgi:hypothetical protein